MISKLRILLWKILGVDYNQTLQIHDYVFLKKDKYSSIGDRTYDNGALVFRWTDAPLEIGKYCSIANDVRFIVDEGFHDASTITSYPLVNNLYKNEMILNSGKIKKEFLDNIKQKAGIKIGNDVWIGMGTYIMPGITVGNGVTIGANSVVTKDLPDYSVTAGVPARVINMKFDNQTIKELNKISWWDWDEDIIKERIETFYSDHNDFINKYKIKE